MATIAAFMVFVVILHSLLLAYRLAEYGYGKNGVLGALKGVYIGLTFYLRPFLWFLLPVLIGAAVVGLIRSVITF